MEYLDSTMLDAYDLWPKKFPNSLLNRFNQTIKFILPLEGKIADCGESNPMKMLIENHLHKKIKSLNWNFNELCPYDEDFDVILCFEVLEHIYNPLLFLEEIKDRLTLNGKIYLSTPYQRPQLLKAKHHYHEIPTDRLMWLFKAAKLKIVREGKVTISGNWYEHLKGIRPMLRYFQKSRIYEIINTRENKSID